MSMTGLTGSTGLVSWVKKNKGFTFGVGIVLLILIALCLVLFTDLGRIIKNEPKIITSNVEIIGEYKRISDVGDLELRDNILNVVNSGRSGYYEFSDRKFVILTTGGQSVSDIEYKIEGNTNGESTVYWNLSNEATSEMQIRYKVIEVTGNTKVAFETKDISIKKDAVTRITGVATFILFEDGNQKKLFNPRNNESIQTEIKLAEGIYTISFEDGEATDYEGCTSIEVNDCKIESQVIGRTYKVKIPSGETLTVNIDEANIRTGDTITLELSYSNGFKGKVAQGGRVNG